MNYKQVLFELKQIEGNNKCMDCGAQDPRWASLNYGIFLCSKCFDIHRSLKDNDTLLSLEIDNWSEDQLKKLQLGGNANAIKFFEKQSDYRKDMSVKEKYTSKFSKTYIEKLLKKCEKNNQSSIVSSSSSSSSSSPSSSSLSDKASSPIKSDITDDNKHEGKNKKDGSPTDNNWENIYLYNSDPSSILDPNLKEFDNISLLRVYRPSKERNEQFFEKLGRENEMRREDIPPSQGGKYTGFGSKPLITEKNQNENLVYLQNSLVSGWNFITKSMSMINENIIKPASVAVRDPNLHQNLENYAESIKHSITEKPINSKEKGKEKEKDDLILSSMDSDISSSSGSKVESNIVIEYDSIENSGSDSFIYSKSGDLLNINNINNENDLIRRNSSNHSFSSINESLSRAYSIGNSSNSLLSIKISKSNRNSISNGDNIPYTPGINTPIIPSTSSIPNSKS
ncbi:ArfGap-domain-containing protein [Neocallimastix californiae]|uniref:ArfGap-domain-containing protein n=1 Tax=Neocallimastix californiae TaxID=1754190 RepID=A0A1Y2FHD5_9FUNG|nr:ArfGap-domain-containing protein [Neocallimastix californiae]|eukprot:ORY83339.1 ArfGap-domain-containing protein [Neocallimastix californiae]